MAKREIPKEILKILKSIKNKRAEIVINHIIEHGSITTEQLEKEYGYSHPPRAARDVRESGIPLETFYVKSSEGKKIGAYRFGDFSKIEKGKLGGRTVFPKKFKTELIDLYGNKCAISGQDYESRYLQIDHRVPYEVAGDGDSTSLEASEFMLLSSSSNRAKSWSCEHCENWLKIKKQSTCKTCYWAYPESYSHIAMTQIRRLDITWSGSEIEQYNKLAEASKESDFSIQEFIKNFIDRNKDQL